MIGCPDCGRSISNLAAACPHCGRPMREASASRWNGYQYEYRSRRTLFGLPLVHVMLGPTWMTGLRPACGIVAVGHVAFGLFAFGGVALGLVAFGGIALGLVALGGIAIGLGLGAGGIGIGYWAFGGIAIGTYAIGSLAIGTHTLQNDPELLRIAKGLFGRS